MKLTRSLIIGISLLVIMIFAGWKMRTFFLQNHVTFLLNQEEIPAALYLVDRLQKQNPDNQHVQFLKIKALTIAGQIKNALQAPYDNALSSDEPEVLYWRAVAQYHQGDEAAARQSASSFVSIDEKLSNPESANLVRQIAGRNSIPADIDINSDSFRMLFDVEKALYLAFAASKQVEAGRSEQATELYEQAFALGLRSNKVLPEAVRAAALSGATQTAEMFLAFTSAETTNQMFNAFKKDYDQFQSPTMVLDGNQAYGSGGRLAQARALAWITVAYTRPNPTALGEDSVKLLSQLQSAFPNDPQLWMRAAELNEMLGNPQEAWTLYNQVHKEEPSLTAALRIWAIDGLDQLEISQRLGAILKLTSPVELISTGTTSTGLKPDVIFDARLAAFTINVTKPDSYVITVIAKGQPVESRWPVMSISIDEQAIAMKYISRKNWDGYSIQTQISEGEHVLEFADKSDPKASGTLEILAIAIEPPVSQI